MLCGALALIGASACGDDDDGATVPGGQDVDIETSQGVPDCFPDDAPIPDGDVKGGFFNESDGGLCTFLVETDSDVTAAIDGYRSALEDDGWEVAYEVPGEDGASIGLTKGDDGIAVGGITANEATTLTVTSGTAESIASAAPPTTAAG